MPGVNKLGNMAGLRSEHLHPQACFRHGEQDERSFPGAEALSRAQVRPLQETDKNRTNRPRFGVFVYFCGILS